MTTSNDSCSTEPHKTKEETSSSAIVSSETPACSESGASKDEEQLAEEEDGSHVYVSGLKLAFIMTALMASMFLVALDRIIIATAIPRITKQFNSLDDVGWYAGAYLLTSCATQLLWGRIFTFYSTKVLYLASICIFEVGSAVCGAATSSNAFIVGRAIAGLGSAGIFSGTTVIITHILPLRKRPMYVGLMGSMFGLSSILGPVLGGAFTDKVSWRWCFYINLPIGALILAILVLFLKVKHTKVEETLKRQLIRLDPLGTALFLPGIVCIILALQWGGVTYPWSNGRIIALFVVGGIALAAFIGVQAWRKEDATTPPRIVMQRSIVSGMLFSFFVYGGLISMLYALPLWFQGVKSVNAIHSGIDTIPMVLGLVVGAIISGAIITATGYYKPWMSVCSTFMSVGAGLTTTFKPTTNHPAWIGYQVLFGLGLGVGMQQPSLSAQTVLAQKDVSIGISLMFFAQALGGAVTVAISQTLFNNELNSNLRTVSGIDIPRIIASGSTGLKNVVPADKLGQVLTVYNNSLTSAFIVSVVVSALAIIPAITIEGRNIKKENVSVSAH